VNPKFTNKTDYEFSSRSLMSSDAV